MVDSERDVKTLQIFFYWQKNQSNSNTDIIIDYVISNDVDLF